MNEKRIKLDRNVVWNMQFKPLAEYQGKGYGSISYREYTGLTYYLEEFNLFFEENSLRKKP